MRPDHWIKQLFILPGFVFALFKLPEVDRAGLMLRLLQGFFAVCLIASANYVINEWLDRDFDRFHPIKKHRSVVEKGADPRIVYGLYAVLSAAGLVLSFLIGLPFGINALLLWIMGILYNVKPFRTKDIPFLDVLSESVNNALRLMLGWFLVTEQYLPPSSLVFGYWMAGAFLMDVKRFSEYRMIGNPETAGLYRKSFRHYTEKSLLLSAFFYGMCATMFLGVFLIKYDVNMVLLMPPLIGLFCYYFFISYKKDSAAQKPEKLFRERGLMIYVLILLALFYLLLKVDIPFLDALQSTDLIPLPSANS